MLCQDWRRRWRLNPQGTWLEEGKRKWVESCKWIRVGGATDISPALPQREREPLEARVKLALSRQKAADTRPAWNYKLWSLFSPLSLTHSLKCVCVRVCFSRNQTLKTKLSVRPGDYATLIFPSATTKYKLFLFVNKTERETQFCFFIVNWNTSNGFLYWPAAREKRLAVFQHSPPTDGQEDPHEAHQMEAALAW